MKKKEISPNKVRASHLPIRSQQITMFETAHSFAIFVVILPPKINHYAKLQHLGSALPPLFRRQLARFHRQVVKNQSGNWEKSHVYVFDYFGLYLWNNS